MLPRYAQGWDVGWASLSLSCGRTGTAHGSTGIENRHGYVNLEEQSWGGMLPISASCLLLSRPLLGSPVNDEKKGELRRPGVSVLMESV